MSERIIMQNGENPQPTPPLSMDDLLNRAHNSWQFKKKDEAIRYMIAGMRLLSQGMARVITDLNELKARMDENK